MAVKLPMTTRIAVLLFTFFLTASACAAENWATAVSRKGDRAIVFRFLKEVDAETPRSQQAVRVILVWRYQSETGMPSGIERAQMDALEDALYPAVTKDRFASLALVSTGENLREWIYYAKSEAEFFDRLNQSTQGHPRFPIDVHVAPDPKWESYEKFRSGIRE